MAREYLESGKVWEIRFPDNLDDHGRLEKLEFYSSRSTNYSAVTAILAERGLKYLWDDRRDEEGREIPGLKTRIDNNSFYMKQVPRSKEHETKTAERVAETPLIDFEPDGEFPTSDEVRESLDSAPESIRAPLERIYRRMVERETGKTIEGQFLLDF